jgi:hypothetical protein
LFGILFGIIVLVEAGKTISACRCCPIDQMILSATSAVKDVTMTVGVARPATSGTTSSGVYKTVYISVSHHHLRCQKFLLFPTALFVVEVDVVAPPPRSAQKPPLPARAMTQEWRAPPATIGCSNDLPVWLARLSRASISDENEERQRRESDDRGDGGDQLYRYQTATTRSL